MDVLVPKDGVVEGQNGTFLDEVAKMSRFNIGAERAHNAGLCDSFGRLIGKSDLTAVDLFDARDKSEFGVRGENLKPYSVLNERLDINPQWKEVVAFLCHDVGHLAAEANILWHVNEVDNILQLKGGDSAHNGDVLPMEFQALYQQVLLEFPALLEQMIYPYQFTVALSEMESGRNPSEIADIDLKGLIHAMARNLQLRFYHDDYVLAEKGQKVGGRNSIELDLNDASVISNPGMIWSIIYNLLKNAGKELSSPLGYGSDMYKRLHDGKMPEKPKKIFVQTQSLEEQGVTLIHVADSGKGLRVDEIIDSLKEILKKGLVDGSNLGKSVARILNQWQGNPFAVRGLNLGNIYDFTALARLSGFATSGRVGSSSSGLGLWGANYLADKMGGAIISTNTVDSGAMFTVVLPNDYFGADRQGKRQIRRVTRSVRSGLERGRIPVELPLAA